MGKKFKLTETISGWVVFAAAVVTYLLTIEPTASLWDCGEYIASAFKLEVGHPPGNPVFMVIARFFSFFAFFLGKLIGLWHTSIVDGFITDNIEILKDFHIPFFKIFDRLNLFT